MTKISNQYSLTNILTADLANSRLGINNVSPAYSLDVTGTARVNTSAYFATASGSVGIGTTSPSEKLVIYGTSASRPRLIVGPITTSTALYSAYNTQDTPAIEVNTSTTTGFAGLTMSNSNNTSGNTLGVLSFAAAGTSNSEKRGAIIGCNLESVATSSVTANLVFYTTSASSISERMRITSAGNVGIGTSTPNGKLEVAGRITSVGTANNGIGAGPNFYLEGGGSSYTILQQSVSKFEILTYDGASWGYRMAITAGGTTQFSGDVFVNNAKGLYLFTESNGAYWLLRTYNAASNQFRFNYQGSDLAGISTVNGSYTAFSDVNKKKDFEPSQIGLNEVLGLKPTLYRIKTQADTEDKQLGFIAQEVKEFIPQAYSETGEGDDKFIGLTEMPIIAALTKAIQELSAKVTLLENK